MSRSSHQIFRSDAIAGLARQIKFVPPDKRREQLDRCEHLHDELDPDGTYPFDFIRYRITGYRSKEDDADLLVGEAVLADLRLLIDALSRSVALSLDEIDEKMETIETLAKRLNVSTKTIGRWRKAGLRWRRVINPATQKRIIVFPESAIHYFQTHFRNRSEQAAKFNQMSERQRELILRDARSMVERHPRLSFNRIATRLAAESGRAVETIRLLLERHDHDRPDDPIFKQQHGPVSSADQRIIARAVRMGVAPAKIAARFGRSKTTIHRIAHQRRAAELKRLPLRFVANPTFERDDADEVILDAPELIENAAPAPRGGRVQVDDLPAAIQPLYTEAPLTPQLLRLRFRKYNYLKFKAVRGIEALHRYAPLASAMNAIDAWLADANAIRHQIVATNLPVVLSVSRRHLIDKTDQSMAHLTRLLEHGNRVLYDAIEAYDLSRQESFVKHLTFNLQRAFVADFDSNVSPGRVKASVRDDGMSLFARMCRDAEAHGIDLNELKK